jgi:Cell division protein CrgA
VKPRTPKGFATQEAVVPKSRVRKKTVYTPPPPKSGRRKVSPPWVGPTIVVLLVFGLAWIAVYYISQNAIPGLSALGNWNLVIGFVLIVSGVTLSTRWR